jgi:redox-sensitive bicupin YhaK (pirin superfamily)
MTTTQSETVTSPTQAAASVAASRNSRLIAGVYRAPPLHWVGDGFRVAGYFSAIPDAVRRLSPFLLLDYHPPYTYPPSQRPRGVGVHPHRGFETVTIAFEGSVAHHDSAGGGGVIGAGDVQWMTAASGVLHKEYHEQKFSREGGVFHMAQLWVNLPRAHKFDKPRYQALLAEQMGVVNLPEAGGSVRVIAGEYEGVRGPAQTFTRVDLYEVRLNAGGKAEFAFPERHNFALLVMSGELSIHARTRAEAATRDFVVFENDGERVSVEAPNGAHVLVLGGEPIDEPVVQYGPFVMNTDREIAEAFADFNSGKFGELED